MSDRRSRQGASGEQRGAQKREAGAGRRFAEWISLGVSAVLLLGLAGYLLLLALTPSSPYIVAEARPLTAEVQQKGEVFILPVEISNLGQQALRELKVEVRATEPGGKSETRDVSIDYLGQQSVQKVYLYFESDPRSMKIEAEPVHYLVD